MLANRIRKHRVLTCIVVAGLLAIGARCSVEPRTGDRWFRQEQLFAQFNDNTRCLSMKNAYLLALATFLANEETGRKAVLQEWGFGRYQAFYYRKASIFGYVASNDRIVVVAFCGTDFLNPRDIVSDLPARKMVQRAEYCSREGALMHNGFCKSLDVAWKEIHQKVQSQLGQNSNKSVWITGHSRGGALAILAALALAQDPTIGTMRIRGVYTFGQPRVGNIVFSEAAKELPYFRIVNGGALSRICHC